MSALTNETKRFPARTVSFARRKALQDLSLPAKKIRKFYPLYLAEISRELTEAKNIFGIRSRMIKPALWIISVFVFTLAIGPVSVVASQSGLPDNAGVYLVFEFGSSAGLTRDMSSSGAHELGPIRPPLARMILASQTAHDQLQASGYIMIPASALAALCGVEVPKINQVPRA